MSDGMKNFFGTMAVCFCVFFFGYYVGKNETNSKPDMTECVTTANLDSIVYARYRILPMKTLKD